MDVSLFLLANLASDKVLASEIVESGSFDLLRQCLLSPRELTRLLTVAVYERLVQEEISFSYVDAKEVRLLLVYLEEYMLKNVSRGIFLLWKICESLSTLEDYCRLMLMYGAPRLVSFALELDLPQKIIKAVLGTTKHLSQHHSSTEGHGSFLFG